MAPKKSTPFYQHPPSESSSDDEEEEQVSESEESDEEPPQPQLKVSTKAVAPPLSEVKSANLKKPEPVSQVSTDEEGSESGSDTGSEMEVTPPAPDLAVKVHAPKPAEAKSKLKQVGGGGGGGPAAALSAVDVVKSGKKRAGESGKGETKDVKKLKKVADVVEQKKANVGEEEVKKVGEDSKKQLFQRLFSEADEVEVLKGMLEYSEKKGIDPMDDLIGFHEYVKGAIHVDVTTAQLVDKIRRLKKKYGKNASKSKMGVDRTFGKPHEQISYDLSKKIWGFVNAKTEENEKTKENAKVKAVSANGGFELKANGKGKRTPKPNMTPDQKEKHALTLQIPKDLGVKNDKEHVRQSSSSSLSLLELTKSKDAAGVGLNEEFVKGGLELLGDEAKAGFDGKWEELLVAEGKLYLKRMELVREQMKQILDAYQT